jgi:hypothetical protein
VVNLDLSAKKSDVSARKGKQVALNTNWKRCHGILRLLNRPVKLPPRLQILIPFTICGVHISSYHESAPRFRIPQSRTARAKKRGSGGYCNMGTGNRGRRITVVICHAMQCTAHSHAAEPQHTFRRPVSLCFSSPAFQGCRLNK